MEKDGSFYSAVTEDLTDIQYRNGTEKEKQALLFVIGKVFFYMTSISDKDGYSGNVYNKDNVTVWMMMTLSELFLLWRLVFLLILYVIVIIMRTNNDLL